VGVQSSGVEAAATAKKKAEEERAAEAEADYKT
jgi:hypothetical protein